MDAWMVGWMDGWLVGWLVGFGEFGYGGWDGMGSSRCGAMVDFSEEFALGE